MRSDCHRRPRHSRPRPRNLPARRANSARPPSRLGRRLVAGPAYDDCGGGGVMGELVTIVDRGRGPQLSTSRITVQDLVPYFQDGCPAEEIIRWIPVLTAEEVAVVERYY